MKFNELSNSMSVLWCVVEKLNKKGIAPTFDYIGTRNIKALENLKSTGWVQETSIGFVTKQSIEAGRIILETQKVSKSTIQDI